MPEMMIAEQLARLRRQRTAPLILELDLTDGVAEGPPADPVSAVLTLRRARLSDLLDGLRRARSDPRVKALVAKVCGRPTGRPTVPEVSLPFDESPAAAK